MRNRRRADQGELPRLVAIPRMRDSDMAAIEMLLRGEGLLAKVLEDYGDGRDELYVRAADLEKVKQLLSDFRTADLAGNPIPIPW